MTQKKITTDMIKDWQGSDNLRPDYLLCLLAELINEEYTIPEFREDVLDYSNQGK